MAQFIERYARKMEDAMELSITSNEIFDNFLQGKCNDAAEQGREEGRKEGRKEGIKEGIKKGIKKGIKEGEEKTVVYFYKKGLIPRDEAIAKLGVTDQEFEILLQNYS